MISTCWKNLELIVLIMNTYSKNVEIFKLFLVFRVNLDSDPNQNPSLKKRIRIRIRKNSLGFPTLLLWVKKSLFVAFWKHQIPQWFIKRQEHCPFYIYLIAINSGGHIPDENPHVFVPLFIATSYFPKLLEWPKRFNLDNLNQFFLPLTNVLLILI